MGAFYSWSSSCIDSQLDSLLLGKKATVGVAFLVDGKLSTYHNDEHYPLMSVFKLHVAIAALQKMNEEQIPLNEMHHIKAQQMHHNTYSPLLKFYPKGDFYLTYDNLLRYALAHSDNNACDILIDFVGGIDQVKNRIDQLGIIDYNLTETEASMHANIPRCYNNWAKPSSVVTLLEKVYTLPILSEAHATFFKEVLLSTTTGQNKMRAGLPADIPLGHKTGSSGQLSNGLTIADNDAGIIYLPHNRYCFVAIFIKDSQEDNKTNAHLIAEITRIITKIRGMTN